MALPLFSQMLVSRRKELGLTLEQASRVLKMKEQALAALEQGDWDHIPRSGYAQGILSSYARYLGLNPRAVVDQFKDDLYAWRTRAQAVEDPAIRISERSRGYAERYRGQRPSRDADTGDLDLYGSAGPAGPIVNHGIFDDEIHRRLSSGRSGHRGAGYAERYRTSGELPLVSEGHRERGGRREHPGETGHRERGEGGVRGAGMRTSVDDHALGRPRRRSTPSSVALSEARRAQRDRIQTRRVSPDMYDDDLVYDPARPYESASSARGRRASRNIASTERPNVRRRRPSQQPGPATRRRLDRDSQGGGGGDSRVTIAIIAILFVVISVLIGLTVLSCTSNFTNADKPQVPVTEAETPTEGSEASEGAPSGTSTTQSQASANVLTDTQVSTTPREVVVSVAEGQVSWVEILMGDMSLVAQTVSGPWSQTFVPTAAMEIQAGDTAAVTVTADGRPLSFDTKASGVGTITIAGPEAQDTGGTDGSGSDEDAQVQSLDEDYYGESESY